jgi:hypothetical protein
VTFHDRTSGSGDMRGYAITTFMDGAMYSKFEGKREGASKVTTGTWKVYKGTGKLAKLQGTGTFNVKAGLQPREFILLIDGDYTM